MVVNAWFRKAERHINICEILFDLKDYPFIINACYLSMFSIIKAFLYLKNIESKTHEGLIYLFKIHYVDNDLFDRDFFRFYCKTKELNSEFFRLNYDFFNEKMALEVYFKSIEFYDYSKKLIESYMDN